MVRFSSGAVASLLVLLGAGRADAKEGVVARGVDGSSSHPHPPPPVGTASFELKPTSSILLERIRDSLLPEDEEQFNNRSSSSSSSSSSSAAAAALRGEEERRRRRALLAERSLRTALSHPHASVDLSVFDDHQHASARELAEEHNDLVQQRESTRHLSRYEVYLRRSLGLYPFGDLDPEGALDEGREGYGPLGQLRLSKRGETRMRALQNEDEDLPPPKPEPGLQKQEEQEQQEGEKEGQPAGGGGEGQPYPNAPPKPKPEPGLQDQNQQQEQQQQQPEQEQEEEGAGAAPPPGGGGPPPPTDLDELPPPPPLPEPGLQQQQQQQQEEQLPPPPPPPPPPGGVTGVSYIPPGEEVPGSNPPPPGGVEPPVVPPPGMEIVPPPPGGAEAVPPPPGEPSGKSGSEELPPNNDMPAMGKVEMPEPGVPTPPGGEGPGSVPPLPPGLEDLPPLPPQAGGNQPPPPPPVMEAPVPPEAGGQAGLEVPSPPPPPPPGGVAATPTPLSGGGEPGVPPGGGSASPPEPGQQQGQNQQLPPSGEEFGQRYQPPPPDQSNQQGQELAPPEVYAGLGPVVQNNQTTTAPAAATVTGSYVYGNDETGQQQQQQQDIGNTNVTAQFGQTEGGSGNATATEIETTAAATAEPTAAPTSGPTASPTSGPTKSPTFAPTASPTFSPTVPKEHGEGDGGGGGGEPGLPAETPPDVVVPPDAPPDAALPPGYDTGGEILSGGLLNSYQTVPLLQGFGTHYSTVWVGSPVPQRVSVIVDTGSHFTAFPCKGCSGCGEEHHTDDYFDPDISDTFRALDCTDCSNGARCSQNNGMTKKGGSEVCTFGQSYTEGSSWRAYEAVDAFFCGGPTPESARDPVDVSYAIEFMFGCQTSETGLFVGQLADGIMGMAAHDATLVKRMYSQGRLRHLMFAMCFRRELDASKSGVTAGVLTLGGVDSRLERTPMVYARNKVHDGWFTVYVKAMYLRPGGGQSAAVGGGLGGPFGDAHSEHDDPGAAASWAQKEHKPPVRIDMNPGQINSGKGVIVDSGTTDTYFHRALAPTFNKVWKEIVGRNHDNKPVKLSAEELLALPTLLIQIEAYDDGAATGGGGGGGDSPGGAAPGETPTEQKEEDKAMMESVPGTAGKLDPSSPNDVLLAIPASHYMEYTPKDDTYTSRLYFSESAGGVLGANAMMGHDILFDWENGRVGFAESSCEYRDVVAVNEMEGEDEGVNGGNDCRLGVPTLYNRGCVDSLDLSQCDKDPDTTLIGTEKWTMVVESPGTPSGMSCEEVILRGFTSDDYPGFSASVAGSSVPAVSCDGNGLCTSTLSCAMNCLTAQSIQSQGEQTIDDDNYAFGPEDQQCGNDLWGACEYSCNQTRVKSVLMTDGECHERSRETRPCHVDACGRNDPCRVPFVVHAIMGFRGANAPLFSGRYEEWFVEAFSSTVNMNRVGEDELFGPGDVKVLSANHWYGSDDSGGRGDEPYGGGREGGSESIGMKLIVEVSVFNPNARLPVAVYEPVVEGGSPGANVSAGNATEGEGEGEGEEGGGPGFQDKAKQTIGAMMTAVRNAWDNLGGPPMATCEESDMYPLARNALHVHMELERDTFMKELIIVLQENSDATGGGGASEYGWGYDKGSGSGGDSSSASASASWSDPFSPLYKTRSYQDESVFLSSWTIKTEIGGGTFHDHTGDFSSSRGFNWDTALYYAKTNAQFLVVAAAALACVCCVGCCCGRSCARRRYERHAATLMERLAARADEKRLGKYEKVGLNLGEDDDDEDDDDDAVGFSGVTYRDDPISGEGGADDSGGGSHGGSSLGGSGHDEEEDGGGVEAVGDGVGEANGENGDVVSEK